MLFTLSGISTDVIFSQLLKEPSRIPTVPSKIFTLPFFPAGQLINTSLPSSVPYNMPSSDLYIVFPAATLIVSKWSQLPNTLFPIFVVLAGIVICFKFWQ